MSFPIEFVKSSGDFDCLSPVVNFTGNAALVAVGGISLGAIAYLALKALGFGEVVTTIATAIPITIGVIGVIGAIAGSALLLAIGIAFVRACQDRR